MNKLSIWAVRVDEPINYVVFSNLMQYAPPEKQERILRQRIKQNADNMLVGAVLAKCMIGQQFHIPFDQQQISYGKYGKPYLKDFPNVHFNISHSGQFVACVVSDKPVGIDIQEIVLYQPDIAKRICTPTEVEQIENSTNPESEFIKLWTKKESYVKLTGQGIGCGMKEISFPDNLRIRTIDLENSILSIASET